MKKIVFTLLLVLLFIPLYGQKYRITEVLTATWDYKLDKWNFFQDEKDFYGTILFDLEDDSSKIMIIKGKEQYLKYTLIVPVGQLAADYINCNHYFYGTDAADNMYFFILHHYVGENMDYVIIFIGGGKALKFIVGDKIKETIT